MILGGPYANFAGHDASRGLAKNSFDADMLTDPNEPIDKLEDLAADEWESLREWEVGNQTSVVDLTCHSLFLVATLCLQIPLCR